MTDAGSATSDSLLGDFTIDRRKSMVDQAHTLLQNAIISSKLPPGQVLKERELCDILSISRTPIREALLRLQEDGLVEIFPQAGTYVSRISIEAVHESLRDIEACPRFRKPLSSAAGVRGKLTRSGVRRTRHHDCRAL